MFSSGCLRDVPTPRETELKGEGPAVQIPWGAYLEPWEEMPMVSLVYSILVGAPVSLCRVECE